MFDNILNLFKRKNKEEVDKINKEKAKERLHLVLMQDRANVSADFLDLMKQEIIDVIKKYIDVDEDKIEVKLTNKLNGDGTTGAPALYANIPIKNIKKETRINSNKDIKKLEEIGKENSQPVVTTATTSTKVKEEIKQEDHSVVIDVPESKANSAAFVDKVDEKKENKVKTEEPKVEANNSATTAKATVATKGNEAVDTTTKQSEESKDNSEAAKSESKTELNKDSDVKTENKTDTSNDNKEVNENKTENNDKNEKNGENGKDDSKEETAESKPVKMNKKKTTFFENVPQKKK